MSARLQIGRLSVYAGKIDRGDNGSNPPWRGYCWGSDWPRVSVSRQGSAACLDLSWLMFHASVYWDKSPKTHKDRRDKSANLHKDEDSR